MTEGLWDLYPCWDEMTEQKGQLVRTTWSAPMKRVGGSFAEARAYARRMLSEIEADHPEGLPFAEVHFSRGDAVGRVTLGGPVVEGPGGVEELKQAMRGAEQ